MDPKGRAERQSKGGRILPNSHQKREITIREEIIGYNGGAMANNLMLRPKQGSLTKCFVEDKFRRREGRKRSPRNENKLS